MGRSLVECQSDKYDWPECKFSCQRWHELYMQTSNEHIYVNIFAFSSKDSLNIPPEDAKCIFLLASTDKKPYFTCSIGLSWLTGWLVTPGGLTKREAISLLHAGLLSSRTLCLQVYPLKRSKEWTSYFEGEWDYRELMGKKLVNFILLEYKVFCVCFAINVFFFPNSQYQILPLD